MITKGCTRRTYKKYVVILHALQYTFHTTTLTTVSFRSSASLALTSLPENWCPSTMTGSLGRGGLSSAQTWSTKLSATGTRSLPPLFLIFSSNFLATLLVNTVGSTATTFPPADCSAVHSCHVGTSWIPCLSSSQFSSSCLEAWLK